MLPNLFTTDKKLNFLLLATYWSYISLLLLLIYSFITNDEHSWKLLTFQLVPLLLVAPGMLKQYYRAHSCLCFIILAYFIAYTVEALSELAEATDWIGVTLSTIVFCGAMMASRGLQRINLEKPEAS